MWCTNIGTIIDNSLVIIIPFVSLYRNQRHFGVVNILELIKLFNVTQTDNAIIPAWSPLYLIKSLI